MSTTIATQESDAPVASEAFAGATPMMTQFLSIKAAAPDGALLFYRMGDFYELFFEDAVIASDALDITLTRRGKHRGDDIPMCGVPFHSYETYLARLIRKGHVVAICEQVEDPSEAKKRGAKSVVRREIVRIVTPGTLTEDTLLEAGSNNFLAALAPAGTRGETNGGPTGEAGATGALAFVDVSTGELFVQATRADRLAADLAAAPIRELIVPEDDALTPNWRAAIADAERKAPVGRLPAGEFQSTAGERRIRETFSVAAIEGFGDFEKAELGALGAALAYVALTQIDRMPPLRAPERRVEGDFVSIDEATRASLEILATNAGQRKGSLAHAVDRTRSGPGARLLAARLSAPLRDAARIAARHDAIAYFLDRPRLCEDVHGLIAGAPDMARALSRLGVGRGGPRDLAAIRDGLAAAMDISSRLRGEWDGAPEALRGAAARLADDRFGDLGATLKGALKETPPLLARDGDFIAPGHDSSLDELRTLKDDARRIMIRLEADYRAATGVKSLKIKNNNVLGYFIEISPANAGPLAEGEGRTQFVHRQTLASAVRFTTGELADLDSRIARAKDDALGRELALFEALRASTLSLAAEIAAAAVAIAEVDVACAGARLADEWNYVRPLIDTTLAFEVTGGRHAVVEQFLARDAGRAAFTPNDCLLGRDDASFLRLVTGPNMAGKSTYLRQNALIAILAQAGMYVPATTARIGVADRIYSRVGASDDIARGRSTFMVEMVETAAILNQAGPRALVVLDEIGRGTATFDGLSIAWAAVEHLHDVNRCRALFATHYHELTTLAERLPGLKNVSMRVREWRGEVIFAHEVVDGAADRSYGVAVARLAGMPKSAIRRAGEVLRMLEETGAGAVRLDDLPLFADAGDSLPRKSDPITDDAVRQALRALDLDGLAPREALAELYRLKSMLDER
ncbi:MAG: DNA mismatch repair protein MutS [Alphaproteobacteria bacterium]|nr:DNA mismatch repair protein MutS [Alphaproteobacteria bacterium]